MIRLNSHGASHVEGFRRLSGANPLWISILRDRGPLVSFFSHSVMFKAPIFSPRESLAGNMGIGDITSTGHRAADSSQKPPETSDSVRYIFMEVQTRSDYFSS